MEQNKRKKEKKAPEHDKIPRCELLRGNKFQNNNRK